MPAPRRSPSKRKAPLRDYLAKAVGTKVDLIIPTNYNATVEALGNGSLDFAYLGALTYVKAHERYNVTAAGAAQRRQEFPFAVHHASGLGDSQAGGLQGQALRIRRHQLHQRPSDSVR